MIPCSYNSAVVNPISSCGNAQSQTTSEQASAGLRIAPGSIIPVQLTKTIDAKKVKTGDEAKVTQDLITGNGEVVLPKDTKVVLFMVGHAA